MELRAQQEGEYYSQYYNSGPSFQKQPRVWMVLAAAIVTLRLVYAFFAHL
jgi:hypothetical protein